MRSIESPIRNAESMARRRNELREAAWGVFVSKGSQMQAGIDGVGDPDAQLRTRLRLNLEIMRRHQECFLLV